MANVENVAIVGAAAGVRTAAMLALAVAGVLQRISRERIRIVRSTETKGQVSYEVPGLSAADRGMLLTTRWEKRVTRRLSGIYEQQQSEVARLMKWISGEGRNPRSLAFDGRVARISDAKRAIGTLMSHWREHPDVVEALRNERRRRQRGTDLLRESVRQREERLRRSTPKAAAETTTSSPPPLSALAANLPEPADAATPQVRLLIELLRQDAPEDEILKAARNSQADPIAREDVRRHRIELAHAYEAAIDNDYPQADHLHRHRSSAQI